MATRVGLVAAIKVPRSASTHHITSDKKANWPRGCFSWASLYTHSRSHCHDREAHNDMAGAGRVRIGPGRQAGGASGAQRALHRLPEHFNREGQRNARMHEQAHWHVLMVWRYDMMVI